MDNDSKQLYLQNIEEFLLDEDKIITYMWLGERLCIHVNNAKTLLTDYVEYHKKKHSDVPIRLSYIAAFPNKDGMVSMVVLDSEDKKLVEEKSYFQHIYSIQKTGKPIEHNSLYLLNKLNHFENCLGVLRNDLTEKRTDSDVVVKRQNSYQDSKESVKECASSVSKNNNAPLAAGKDKQTEKQPNSFQKNTKPNSISSMFANQTKKKKPAESKPEKKQNGMACFIKKEPNGSTNVNSKPEKSLKPVETKPIKDVTVKKENVKDSSDAKSLTATVQKIKKEKDAIKDNKAPMKAIVSKDKAKVDKKRKRVMHISDSEESADEKDAVDDDPFKEEDLPMSDCDDDIIQSTPTTGKIKINSNTLNPKKFRKVVDKTYADEDGYILTRKEEVMETCTDDDVIEDQNKPSNLNAAKVDTVKQSSVKNKPAEKKSPPVQNKKKQITPKGKQSMLTNFFVRKT